MNLEQYLEAVEDLDDAKSNVANIQDELHYLANRIVLDNFSGELPFAERKAILLEILQGLGEEPIESISQSNQNPYSFTVADLSSAINKGAVISSDMGKRLELLIPSLARIPSLEFSE